MKDVNRTVVTNIRLGHFATNRKNKAREKGYGSSSFPIISLGNNLIAVYEKTNSRVQHLPFKGTTACKDVLIRLADSSAAGSRDEYVNCHHWFTFT